MSKTQTSEATLSANHEADPTETILRNLTYALHSIAAEQVLGIDTKGLPPEQREALCLMATQEVLRQLQFGLIMAPQGSLTSEILRPLSQAKVSASQQIDKRFPQDEAGEQKLATLISTLRANIKSGKKD